MADVQNQQEPTLPAKRKPDLCCQNRENVPNKTQKLQSFESSAPEDTPEHKDEENHGSELGNLDSSAEEKIENRLPNSQEKTDGIEEDRDENGGAKTAEDEDDNDGVEDLRREAEVDRKGKGILRGDKGKGKLIEEDDSEEGEDSDGDDDDSSYGGNESDGDSDLSDDPLAEIDLDNILSSRTRTRATQPGLYISNEIDNDDDDSDDSDA